MAPSNFPFLLSLLLGLRTDIRVLEAPLDPGGRVFEFGVSRDLGLETYRPGQVSLPGPFLHQRLPALPWAINFGENSPVSIAHWVGGYDKGSVVLTGRWGWPFTKRMDTPLPSQGTSDPD